MTKTRPPAPFVSRPATRDDAEAVTELTNSCGIAMLGHPTTEISEALTDWQRPYCNPTTNIRLVVNGERVVGYAGV